MDSKSIIMIFLFALLILFIMYFNLLGSAIMSSIQLYERILHEPNLIIVTNIPLPMYYHQLDYGFPNFSLCAYNINDINNIKDTLEEKRIELNNIENQKDRLRDHKRELQRLSNKVSEIKREEAVRGEPKSEVKPASKGKTIHGISSFDMDDFKV